MTASVSGYDPFVLGPHPVDTRSFEAPDPGRRRLFPCEVWFPADLSGTCPLLIYSHPSGGGRRAATFLTTHLASHGYLVAALDHSEMIAPDLARRDGETAGQKEARWKALMESRISDVRFLLDRLIERAAGDAAPALDANRVGIAGHSLGGWTALASVDVEPRIRSVVALAPGGASRPKPGILPATLAFAWGRDVPTLYLVAENDTSLPLSGMYELLERTPAAKQMVILRRADHMHFMDDAESLHEKVRSLPPVGDLAWLPREMRPIGELCSGEQAHLFVRGLSLAHFDATLRERQEARDFLSRDLRAALAQRGVDAILA
jgi:predicted dienelactone hydrolase